MTTEVITPTRAPVPYVPRTKQELAVARQYLKVQQPGLFEKLILENELIQIFILTLLIEFLQSTPTGKSETVWDQLFGIPLPWTKRTVPKQMLGDTVGTFMEWAMWLHWLLKDVQFTENTGDLVSKFIGLIPSAT